jgi:hypothetical protein
VASPRFFNVSLVKDGTKSLGRFFVMRIVVELGVLIHVVNALAITRGDDYTKEKFVVITPTDSHDDSKRR